MQKIILLGSICFTLLIADAASATTYYVSVGGSDLDAGTSSQPWRTLARAASAVAPGDTVLVQPGVYDEYVQFTHSGTAESPITVKANGAVTNSGNFAIKASYFTLDGFEHTAQGTYAYYGPIWFYDTGVSNVWIINNKFHDNPPKIGPGAVVDFQSNSGFSN